MFSLRSLRATKGVLVFLEKGSVEAMAKALGHKFYTSKLIEHYLPKPILEFFQERWVRIFLTGLIVEAMKESVFLLEATAFESMAELDEFMREHAIKAIPAHLRDPESTDVGAVVSRDRAEVVFGVNEGILTLLLSVERAVDKGGQELSGIALYWAAISKRLSAFIDSSRDRPDLKHFLAAARVHASPARIEHLLNDRA